jgi:hypothetical protein
MNAVMKERYYGNSGARLEKARTQDGEVYDQSSKSDPGIAGKHRFT